MIPENEFTVDDLWPTVYRVVGQTKPDQDAANSEPCAYSLEYNLKNLENYFQLTL